MKFPGSKLLYDWDLATRRMSLDDLQKACRDAGLTGFAEVKFPQAAAMIFYYLGGELNALFREGPVAYHGPEALERLRTRVGQGEGTISVYELPLDMAHLLRGITNRHRLKESLGSSADLEECLRRFAKAEHTGTLEVQSAAGVAMFLLVRGRISNVYWETSDGLTYEKGEAHQLLEAALEEHPGQLYLADFSRTIWKSRHDVQGSVRSRLQRPGETDSHAVEELVAAEESLRQKVLDELQQKIPALIQTFMFDLMTGSILARCGRGTSGVKVNLLAERVPAMTLYLRDLVAVEEADQVEVIEISTERIAVLVGIVGEAQEAIAVFAEKSQPTALVNAALTRAVRDYAMAVQPVRTPAAM